MESEATQATFQELTGDILGLETVFPNTGAFSNEKIIGSVSPIVCPHPDCRTSVALVGTVQEKGEIQAGFHCKNGHRLNMGFTATEKGAELTITTSRQPASVSIGRAMSFCISGLTSSGAGMLRAGTWRGGKLWVEI